MLVVACHITLVPYHIALPSWPLIACTASGLSCCTALLSSHCAGWLLLFVLPLSPYHLVPPSCLLDAPAGCCMLPLLPYCLVLPSCPLIVPAGCCFLCRLCPHIVLRCPLVLSSCWVVVVCRASSCCPIVTTHLCEDVNGGGMTMRSTT